MVEWKEGRGTSTALISVGGVVVLELWADGQDGDFDALCDNMIIARGLPTLEAAQAAAIAHAVKVLTEALAVVAPELVMVAKEKLLTAAVAEYTLCDNVAGPTEIMGRHAATRGMMVRLGLYSEFAEILETDATLEEIQQRVSTEDSNLLKKALLLSAEKQYTCSPAAPKIGGG